MDKTTQAKELFISIAAHKLLTPLTLIKWNIELLKKEAGLSESAKQKVNDIEESVLKLDVFSNILMKIVQLKSDESDLAQKTNKVYKVNIHKVIEDIKKELKLEDILKVESSLDLNTERDLLIEEKEFHYILSTLIENAVLYNQNKPEINLQIEADNNHLNLVITDNGIGFSTEEQSLIGSAFYRSTNSQQLTVKGFGLSIYICKLILENIQGNLTIESLGENQGSKCKVKI